LSLNELNSESRAATTVLPNRDEDRLRGSAEKNSAARNSLHTIARSLDAELRTLDKFATHLRMAPLAARDWHNLLTRKLLPQLADDAFLIVAVVGGTNIGKSVVFNHIAGFRASASSPLASGTKHPVCLVPVDFSDRHELQALFPTFQLHPWGDSDEALTAREEHCLYWRSSDRVPSNLVILDTPDVDSDAPVNWQRADAVRQSADILVAVLTQQKYNDAAVKQFFRKAAQEDKAAIVVFNQVELPEDEPYWPVWLKTFCDETGLQPEYVYLAPNDRKAAEAIQLKFEERSWAAQHPENSDPAHDSNQLHLKNSSNGSTLKAANSNAVDLSQVLSTMRFAEIKMRTLRGTLKRLTDEDDGIPAYLREVQARSDQFRHAAELFASRSLIRQADWPAPPNTLIVDEMWVWWDNHREVWTSSVHGFYANVGHWISGGYKRVRNKFWGTPTPPLDEYRKAEWDSIVRVLEQIYQQLNVITTLGNELLTDRLQPLLAGTTCETILKTLQAEHNKFDFNGLIRGLVDTEMSALKNDRQHMFELLRNADRAAAVARPVLTLLLALGGGIGAEHLLTHAATQSLTHVAIDATAAAGTTVAGEAVVESASGIMSQVKAWLLKLHQKFKENREQWLSAKIKQYLLGDLLDDLLAGANVQNSDACTNVRKLTRQLDQSR
jgi:hypothetical protein